MFYSKTLIKVCCLSGWSSSSFMRRSQSYVASFTVRVNKIYSASVDDKTTMACFFKYQLIGPLLNMKIKLEVDFLSSLSLAQSESEYPFTSSLSWPPKMIPHFLEPLKYRKPVFAISVYC